MSGYRVVLMVDGTPLPVGERMDLHKAREISDIVHGELLNDFDSRVSVHVEDDH